MNDTNTEKSDQETCDILLLTLWKLMRNAETSQGVPRFVGFLASIYAKKDVVPTKITYLPPIHTAVTEYRTLVEIFEIFEFLKEFVCLIYGDKKCKSVDKLQAKILHQEFKKQKTVELIMSPPCSRILEFPTWHWNHVTNLYSEANRSMMLLDSPLLHGWTAIGEPEWTDQCFPDDLRDLLLLLRLDDEVDFDEGSEEDISDDDDDGEEL